MKKFLVLAVVLAVSAVASASLTGLTGSVSLDGGVVAAEIAGATTDTYLALTIQGTGSLANFAAGAVAPPDAGLVGTMAALGQEGTYGQGETWTMANIGGSVYNDGTWLTADAIGAVAGDVITLYESDGGQFVEVASLTVAAIPEPATLAILGLGGLLIRRKK